MASSIVASRPAKWALGILAGLAALLVGLVLFVLLFPWNTLRDPLARYLTEKTGRPVAIAGDLTVDLAWHPWIEVNGVAIGNAPWSDEPVMASAKRIGLRIVPLSYFTRLRIPEIEVTGLKALLERNREGTGNWLLDDADERGTDAAPGPLIGRIGLADARLRYRDPDPNLRVDVTLQALTANDRSGTQNLVFAGKGTLRGAKFELAGQGEGLGALRDTEEPFLLSFHAKAGATEALFHGEVVPNAPENVKGHIKLSGQDMAQLYPLLPAPVPWTPPYQLTGHVASLPDRWQVTDLTGKVGRSDVRGTAEILTNTPRRTFVADLVSTRLDYRDLGGFVGLPAGASPELRSAEQKAEAAKLARQERIFSEDKFDLSRLRDYDARFRFRGKSVKVDRVPMESVEMNIVLADGVLKYEPVKIGIADGTVTLAGTLDAKARVPRIDLRLEGRNLDLARIYPELASPRGRTGRFGGFVKAGAQGSSVADMARTADGEGALIMSGGEASSLALLLTNLDLAGIVPLVIAGDRTAALHCAVSQFAIGKGLLRPRILVVDTTRVRIDGSGTVDLANEKYDLLLQSKSKQFSVFALRGPIIVGGSLRDPTVAPSVAPIAARVGVAAGLAAISPPLAILPFIDPGGTPDVDCRQVLGAPDNESIPTKEAKERGEPSSAVGTTGAGAPRS